MQNQGLNHMTDPVHVTIIQILVDPQKIEKYRGNGRVNSTFSES